MNGLQYLLTAYNNAKEEKGKPLNSNPSSQEFIQVITEVIMNYTVLVVQIPDMFPLMLPKLDGDDPIELTSF